MNGIMKENQLTNVKEHDFNKLEIHGIDYLLDDIFINCRIGIFILSNKDLFMILNLKSIRIMKKSISQFFINLWNS